MFDAAGGVDVATAVRDAENAPAASAAGVSSATGEMKVGVAAASEDAATATAKAATIAAAAASVTPTWAGAALDVATAILADRALPTETEAGGSAAPEVLEATDVLDESTEAFSIAMGARNPLEERARAPIHMRGRLPAPFQGKQPAFKGDYGGGKVSKQPTPKQSQTLLPGKLKKPPPPTALKALPSKVAPAKLPAPSSSISRGAADVAPERKRRGAMEEEVPKPRLTHPGEECPRDAKLAFQNPDLQLSTRWPEVKPLDEEENEEVVLEPAR